MADPTLNYLLNWGAFAVPNSPAFNRTHCPAGLLPIEHAGFGFLSQFNLCGQCDPSQPELVEAGCRAAEIVPGTRCVVRECVPG